MSDIKVEYEDDDEICYSEECESAEDVELEGYTGATNIPLDGSPAYGRVFFGDSAKPLQNQYPSTEYVDDNISRTYQGILSYLG